MIPKNNEIRVEPTTICNYNCAFCNHDKLPRKKETMSFNLFQDLIIKIIKTVNQYKTLTFAGMGDPLCDKKIEDKIKFVNFVGLKPLLITNGLNLTVEKFKALQAAGVYSIRVSFHGATPETYAKNHGVKVENFYIVKKQIEDILGVKNRKTKILLTHLITPGINDNDEELFKTMWVDKADMVEVWRVHNWVNSFDFRGVQVERRKTCGRVFNGPLQVQVDGTINSCCFDSCGKLVFGDLKYKTLDEIFNSKEYLELSAQHLSGVYNDGVICKNCDQRNKDRTNALIFSTKYDNIEDRVNRTSTSYSEVK